MQSTYTHKHCQDKKHHKSQNKDIFCDNNVNSVNVFVKFSENKDCIKEKGEVIFDNYFTFLQFNQLFLGGKKVCS